MPSGPNRVDRFGRPAPPLAAGKTSLDQDRDSAGFRVSTAFDLPSVDATEGAHRQRAESSPDPIRPLLLRQKVMIPDSVDGFVDRSALATRCDPLRWRVTTIHAPGGFGKTTLLAEVCRRLRKRGNVVAWLTLDEDDGPTALAAYLYFALSEAGVEVLDSRMTSRDVELADYRINLLIHSIESLGAPCVLALDDIHRLQDPDSLAVVNRLLQRAPPNLHVALAFRGLPTGLDVATPLLERRGVNITAEELRFEKRDIARFFGSALSRAELAEMTQASRGWPIALCIHRNVREQYASDELTQAIISNWIETRLWSGLSEEDREFVLDIGLFDWIDPDLVDDALAAGSMRRVRSISALSGLLQSVGKSGTLSLHPMIRQYCSEKRFRETPDRYRSIHGGIANALVRRGHVLAGMRHAAEAGNPRQVGQVLIDAGGFRIWLKYGRGRLRQVDKLLTADVLEAFPRLGLVRCMELTMRGDFEAAMAIYHSISVLTDGFTGNRDGGEDPGLANDHLCFRFVLESGGCRSVDTPQHRALVSEARTLANNAAAEPVLRGAAMYAMGEFAAAHADFEEALDWLRRARAELANRSWYVRMFADFQIGNIAMARGRVGEAGKAYARARRAAKADIIEDPSLSVIAESLLTELSLERNMAVPPARRSHDMSRIANGGAWLDVYCAVSEVVLENVMADNGPDGALEVLDEILANAETTGLATLLRCLLAWRVSLLVAAGRTADAERVWTNAGFPQEPVEIADLRNQTWREMEAIACAGLRLLTAQAQYDAARELARTLLAVCRERGLRRTEMRGLALSMVLEHQTGNPESACANLIEFLQRFAETDYARPLLWARVVAIDVLQSLNRDAVDAQLGTMAESLRVALGSAQDESTGEGVPDLTPREFEILERLEGWRDKEIAAAVNLTEDGVRYHNKKLFRKLGAKNRSEAVHRARLLAILPTPSTPPLTTMTKPSAAP